MAKNSREGNQNRNKRYREALAERGIRPVQVLAPESAHPMIRQAASLMTRDDEPMDPRAALRQVGGSNESEPDRVSVEVLAELETAKVRIGEIEVEAEHQRRVLEAERDAARAAEANEREKGQVAIQAAKTDQERATEALRRAEKAETTIQQAKSLPGLKGRLVRWLAGDVLE
jgi:hypothetical protein